MTHVIHHCLLMRKLENEIMPHIILMSKNPCGAHASSIYCGVPFMQVHAFEHTTLLATPV